MGKSDILCIAVCKLCEMIMFLMLTSEISFVNAV